ncbi:hypothetical protein RND71_025134 [Anisodus tanguticus]|uniref:Uncharacterized protein n=1 Tax=Anisodus tanguticus TaxID=243964 RepID=A0AAE1RSH0_9SOLA|nr:hypothetical protein RND71_025134 [Anisodus tanguticus]
MKKLAKGESLAIYVSNMANVVLFIAKVYASIAGCSPCKYLTSFNGIDCIEVMFGGDYFLEQNKTSFVIFVFYPWISYPISNDGGGIR